MSDAPKAIAQLLAAQVSAWNRGDLDEFMAGYANEESIVFTADAVIRRGWKNTLARYREDFGDDPSAMGQLALDIVDTRILGDSGALVLGTYRLDDGSEEPATGVFTLGLEKRAEGWRIVHDHTSTADQSEEAVGIRVPLPL